MVKTKIQLKCIFDQIQAVTSEDIQMQHTLYYDII